MWIGRGGRSTILKQCVARTAQLLKCAFASAYIGVHCLSGPFIGLSDLRSVKRAPGEGKPSNRRLYSSGQGLSVPLRRLPKRGVERMQHVAQRPKPPETRQCPKPPPRGRCAPWRMQRAGSAPPARPPHVGYSSHSAMAAKSISLLAQCAGRQDRGFKISTKQQCRGTAALTSLTRRNAPSGPLPRSFSLAPTWWAWLCFRSFDHHNIVLGCLRRSEVGLVRQKSIRGADRHCGRYADRDACDQKCFAHRDFSSTGPRSITCFGPLCSSSAVIRACEDRRFRNEGWRLGQ